MKNVQWMRWAGLVILAGVLMRLFGHPKGDLVFTVGFAAYFIGKLVVWFGRRAVFPRRSPPGLLYLHLGLIGLAITGLLLRYWHYPYASTLFGVALLLESLVNLRIRLNELIGAGTVTLGWQLLRELVGRRRR